MNVPASPSQSTFVTVLAWVLIVFNGFGVFVVLMQNVMINFMLPSMLATHNPTDQFLETFPITFARVVGIVFLGLAVFITYAAYALLKRRNWARRTFIVLFALGILWNILGAVAFGLGFGFSDFPTPGQGTLPPEILRAMFTGTIVVFAIYAVGTSVLFSWLIKRLRSPSVKAEFSNASVVT
jgi:hypothetical protein